MHGGGRRVQARSSLVLFGYRDADAVSFRYTTSVDFILVNVARNTVYSSIDCYVNVVKIYDVITLNNKLAYHRRCAL